MSAFLLLSKSFGWAYVARRSALLVCLGSGFLPLTACGGRAGIISEDQPENGDGDGDGDGRHGDRCEAGAECAEGLHCVEGICITSCASSKECPSKAPTCHEEFGVCVECFRDQECAAGQSCRVGQCVGCSEGEPGCEPDPPACSFGERFCDRQDRVAVCRPDGSGFDYQSCRQEGGRCADGACVQPQCEQETFFCENGDVHFCLDGFEDVLWTACRVDQACVSEPNPSCQDLFCSPSSRGCMGEGPSIAYQCNAAGTAYDAVIPCKDVCVDGFCQDKICEPGTYACNFFGDVTLCSASGTSETVADDCSPSEYCEPGNSSCKAQVCTPMASWCAGENVVTCNESGSGSTIESCAPNDCVAGACQGPSFSEDFEDGNYDGWTFQGGYSATVTTGTAADGSKFSLRMTGGHSGHYDGLHYLLPMPFQAERVSYWVRQDTVNFGTYLTLHDEGQPSTDTEITFVYFTVGKTIAVGTQGGSLPASSYQPETWYRIELVFDWPKSSYDILVDGAVARSDIGFRGTNVDAIARISLYHYTPGSTGYWDEIEIY